ncbi:MAG TPA: hypothetical protein DHV14_10880, partial [Micrococcales bacterium]|nr:hypothetical protein [Micrococcales bacterium]
MNDLALGIHDAAPLAGADRTTSLGEAVAVVRTIWGEPAGATPDGVLPGRFHPLAGAQPGPRHPPRLS